jgi:hypothetical protein
MRQASAALAPMAPTGSALDEQGPGQPGRRNARVVVEALNWRRLNSAKTPGCQLLWPPCSPIAFRYRALSAQVDTLFDPGWAGTTHAVAGVTVSPPEPTGAPELSLRSPAPGSCRTNGGAPLATLWSALPRWATLGSPNMPSPRGEGERWLRRRPTGRATWTALALVAAVLYNHLTAPGSSSTALILWHTEDFTDARQAGCPGGFCFFVRPLNRWATVPGGVLCPSFARPHRTWIWATCANCSWSTCTGRTRD